MISLIAAFAIVLGVFLRFHDAVARVFHDDYGFPCATQGMAGRHNPEVARVMIDGVLFLMADLDQRATVGGAAFASSRRQRNQLDRALLIRAPSA
jgi:hypothetical protein